MALASSVAPTQAAGPDFSPPKHIVVAEGHELQLTGQGRHVESWIVVYGLALYLPGRTASVEEFRSADVPVVLRIEISSDLLPDTLPQAWKDAIRREIDDADFVRLRDVYATLQSGNIVLITYLPAQGSSIAIDGRTIVTDPDRGLMDLFIDHWLGREAISPELRSQLLARLP